MSADNGVYILVTGRGRGKREYRVTHAQAFENLDYLPNYPATNPEVHLGTMMAFFGKSSVFTDRKIAEGYAIRWREEIENEGGICEYGIVWVEYPTIRFPRHAQPQQFVPWNKEQGDTVAFKRMPHSWRW